MHAIWLRVGKSVWGLDRDAVLGGIYVPPQSSDLGRKAQIRDAYTYMNVMVQEAHIAGMYVLLGGDFNAKLGVKSEFDPDECSLMIACFPELAVRAPPIETLQYIRTAICPASSCLTWQPHRGPSFVPQAGAGRVQGSPRAKVQLGQNTFYKILICMP
jgi:hypothetical protein